MGGRGSGGRNKKTAQQRKLTGNAGKRKCGPEIDATAYAGPLGLAPKHFNQRQREIWDELATSAPVGVIEASDRFALELLVCLLAKLRTGKAKAAEVNQISSLLAKLGMTPADRSRTNPRNPDPPEKPKDQWADFTPRTQ